MEFTQENFDKLVSQVEKLTEVGSNKDQAIKEERAKRKQLRDKLDSLESGSNEELELLRKEKADREEKEAKKKGKYEELLTEKDAKIEELMKSNVDFESKATKYDTYLTKQLEEKMSVIPEDKLEFVNKAIDGKDFETKVELLGGFAETFNTKKADFNNKPKEEGSGMDTDKTDFNKAKESGDIFGMIANAPAIE